MNAGELSVGSGGGCGGGGREGFSSMDPAPENGSVQSQVVPPPPPAAADVGSAAPVGSGDNVGTEAASAMAVDAGTAEGGSEEGQVVPVELYKTATEAQAHGEPYFLYREETTGEVNAMPVKKQPLQYVPKHLDWYCSICHFWVDDEQEVCFFFLSLTISFFPPFLSFTSVVVVFGVFTEYCVLARRL